MPPLTEEQLNQIQYVSVKDYCEKVDQIENLNDKLEFSAHYILSYGQGGNQPDYPIDSIIKVAHMKIADKSADIKELYQETEVNKGIGDLMVDPTVTWAGKDVGNQMFIANPVGYLKGKAKDLERQINLKNWKSQDDIRRQLNYGNLRQNVFTDDLNARVLASIKKPTVFDVQARLENAYGGPAGFKKGLEATKPGVFAKMFGKGSIAGKNLDAAYKAFNNPKHVLHGDLPTVEKAATEYLQHVLPSWKPNRLFNIPKPEDIARLSGTQKARAMLSINLLNAAKEQRKMENGYDEMLEYAEKKDIVFDHIPVDIEDKVIIDDNTDYFQKNIAKDVNAAEDSFFKDDPIDDKAVEEINEGPPFDMN